ncbi:hypothetical protein AJ88_41900 [Mesorhizobium amorphae CCBAU 01583]|nr:hypothetical protein AJ88_41900 [Mesorhizobium amorphae CCBAU 01583]
MRGQARLAAGLDPVGECRTDIGLVDRSRRADTGVLRLALQVGDDQPCLARQHIRGVEHGARAVGQHETATLAARPGDAVRPGVDEQRAGRCRLIVLRTAGLFGQPLGKLARCDGARRFLCAKPHQPPLEVGAVAAKAALGEQHGEHCRLEGVAGSGGFGDHVGEPHRQR